MLRRSLPAALLLVLVVLGMNIAAILIRNRLRAKYAVSAI